MKQTLSEFELRYTEKDNNVYPTLGIVTNFKRMNKVSYKILFFFILGILVSCTDLVEVIEDETTGFEYIKEDNIQSIVAPAYGSLRMLWYRERVWGLQEATSDECMFPTRGSDWYDGGVWVDNHLHTWTNEHRDVVATWRALSQGMARANYSLLLLDGFAETTSINQYKAELRFLRSFFMYCYLDLFGKVPFREYNDQDYTANPTIFNRSEAFDFIVGEMEEIIPILAAKSDLPWGRINKDAATMLLAKLYLNREVYTGEAGWNEAINYCDQLISGDYSLATDYFGLFRPDNHINNSEGILIAILEEEPMGMDNQVVWVNHSLHYTQSLGGNYPPWNGAVCPPDFYEKFDQTNDLRFQDDRLFDELKIHLGLLVGQQYDIDGSELKTRQGDPLIFTPECPLSGAGESQGIRVLKYEPLVPIANSARIPNDFLIWRIADVYLMRAEAKIRLGQSGDEDINAVRSIRGLSDLNGATLENILDERGFELYWEGHRRQDLIRFGKFGDAWHEKPVTGENKEVLPIPRFAIETIDDENLLSQNPGY
jgi:hypothetical protein